MKKRLLQALSLTLIFALTADPTASAFAGGMEAVHAHQPLSFQTTRLQENALALFPLETSKFIFRPFTSFWSQLKASAEEIGHSNESESSEAWQFPETRIAKPLYFRLFAGTLSISPFEDPSLLHRYDTLMTTLGSHARHISYVLVGYYSIVIGLTILMRLLERKIPGSQQIEDPASLETHQFLGTRRIFMPDEVRGIQKAYVVAERSTEQKRWLALGTKTGVSDISPADPLRHKTAEALEYIGLIQPGLSHSSGLHFFSPFGQFLAHAEYVLRHLFLTSLPRRLARHMTWLIPFGAINFRPLLSAANLVYFEETQSGMDQIAWASSTENTIYIGRHLADSLSSDQLAGLIARELVVLAAKMDVRRYDLPWLPQVDRIRRISKDLEIRIAGPGTRSGTSTVDEKAEKVQQEFEIVTALQKQPRLFIAQISPSGDEILDVISAVTLQLTHSRQTPSTSRERTAAWAAALATLELLIDSEPLDMLAIYDQITSFEMTLWMELRIGSHAINYELNSMLDDTAERLMEKMVGSEVSIDRFLGLRYRHPKNILTQVLAIFMLKRRNLPMDLGLFWLQGKPEQRGNISLAMEVFYTLFTIQIEHLFEDISEALKKTHGDDRNRMLGEFANLLRYLSTHAEDFAGKKSKQQVEHALSLMTLELKRYASAIGNKAYKAPRYTLNAIQLISESAAKEDPLPLLTGVNVQSSMDPSWRDVIYKYLSKSNDGVLGHCLKVALVVLERTGGDKQAALDASFQAYQRDAKMARAMKSLKLSKRLQLLFLNGPGRIAFNTTGPEANKPVGRATRVILEVSREPIETSLMGVGTGRSLDFTASRFFNVEHLRAYIRHPRLRVIYAYEELPDGRKGMRLARLAVALTKHREILAISHITPYMGSIALYYPFLAYLKNWSDSTGFPVIFWAGQNTKWGNALGYKSEPETLDTLIPDNGSETMILHSDLTPNDPQFPISIKIGAHLRYDPAGRPENVNRPSAQERAITLASVFVGLLLLTHSSSLSGANILTVFAAAEMLALLHALSHILLGGRIRLQGNGFWNKAGYYILNGLREEPNENLAGDALKKFYLAPGLGQLLGGSLLFILYPASSIFTVLATIAVIQGAATAFFGHDKQGWAPFLKRDLLRSA